MLHVKYSMFSLFVKDVEDWFHYGKLYVFVIEVPHILV